MWIQSLGWEDLLKKEMATHSTILAWKNPMDRGAWWGYIHGSCKRVQHNLTIKQQQEWYNTYAKKKKKREREYQILKTHIFQPHKGWILQNWFFIFWLSMIEMLMGGKKKYIYIYTYMYICIYKRLLTFYSWQQFSHEVTLLFSTTDFEHVQLVACCTT